MVKVGPRVGGCELIGEAGARLDRVLGDAGNSVHVVAQCDPVPVDAGAGAELVVHLHSEEIPGLCPDELPCVNPRPFRPPCRWCLSLIHISEPTRRTPISYAVFCLKKKKQTKKNIT